VVEYESTQYTLQTLVGHHLNGVWNGATKKVSWLDCCLPWLPGELPK
jgi:hypothetical protein